MPVTFPLEIFYDGSCKICSAEMQGYRKRNPEKRLVFIDISDADFQPEAYGKGLEDFMAKMHVRDGDGHFESGIEAFMLIWQAFPAGSPYRLLGAFVGFPGIRLLARCGYALFARYRHLLPKHVSGCEDGTCHLKHPH